MLDPTILERSTYGRHILAVFCALEPRPLYANEVAIRLGVPSGNFAQTMRRLIAEGFLEPCPDVPERYMRPLRQGTGRRQWLQLTEEAKDIIDREGEDIWRLSWHYRDLLASGEMYDVTL